MDADWRLNREILLITHRWYVIVAFCLAGALVGALLAYLWPSPYRASRELYVGLNVYQASADRSAAQHAGVVFVNVNDYKNWQMASLNSVVFMDPILDETLARLQVINPYWVGVNREQLAEMLHVYWRNAGKWRLVAEHPWPERAIEAVLTWQDVIVERVHAAVEQSNRALSLDAQIEAAAQEQARIAQSLESLRDKQAALREWQARLTAAAPTLPLSRADSEALRRAAQPFNEADFPPSGAPGSEVAAWLNGAQAQTTEAVQAALLRQRELQQNYLELSQAYTQASQAGLGLSAELLVQKLSRTRVYLDPVRPLGVMMLVGAGLGLLAWAGWMLLSLSRRSRAKDAASD